MQVTITYFWATPAPLDCQGPVPPSKTGRGFLQVTSSIHCSTWGDTLPLLSRLTWTKFSVTYYETTDDHPWHDKPAPISGWTLIQNTLNSYPSLCFSPRAVLLLQLGGRQEHMARGRSQLSTAYLSRLLQSLPWQTQKGSSTPWVFPNNRYRHI